jgi:hypothetical protein
MSLLTGLKIICKNFLQICRAYGANCDADKFSQFTKSMSAAMSNQACSNCVNKRALYPSLRSFS